MAEELSAAMAADGGEALADAVAEEQAEQEEQLDATMLAVLAKLSDEDRAAMLAMDESQIDALFAKVDAGQPLTAQEQAIVDAVQSTMMEQFESSLEYQTGDITLDGGLAVLHLGEEFRYLDPDGASRVLVDAWGNPPGEPTLGMIIPANVNPLDPVGGWGVVITFAEDGYVEDDDADDIDYDELLEQMQEGTEQENPGRTAAGYPAMHLMGWAEPPHYDGDTHRLYWAQDLQVEGAPERTLNYAIRVLGRRGVLELNAVALMPQLGGIRPEMEKVLSRVEFQAGHRYEDFDPDLDKVAAYGIGGLIAGKVLAKAGFFAIILKFLVAAKKFLIFIVIGIGVAIKGLLGRFRKSDDPQA